MLTFVIGEQQGAHATIRQLLTALHQKPKWMGISAAGLLEINLSF